MGSFEDTYADDQRNAEQDRKDGRELRLLPSGYVIGRWDSGDWGVFSADMERCIASGTTPAEAAKRAREALK